MKENTTVKKLNLNFSERKYYNKKSLSCDLSCEKNKAEWSKQADLQCIDSKSVEQKQVQVCNHQDILNMSSIANYYFLSILIAPTFCFPSNNLHIIKFMYFVLSSFF